MAHLAGVTSIVESVADLDDTLVPVHVRVDIDGETREEKFLYDKREKELTPDDVARVLCADLMWPASAVNDVATQIRRRVDDFVHYQPPKDGGELLVPIQINVQHNGTALRDVVTWDVNCRHSDPEQFAEVTVAELQLAREFVPLISFAIRERVQQYRAQLAVGGALAPLPPVHAPVRTAEASARWAPVVGEVANDEDNENDEAYRQRRGREERLARRRKMQ